MSRFVTLSGCAAAFALCAAPGSALTLLSPFVTNPANGHQYALLQNANWSDSEAAAVRFGGHLATIRSVAEQNFVFSRFGAYGGQQHLLWIGLTDTGSPLNFRWTSGAPVTYTNWDNGEPNNASGNESYVAMYYPNFRNPGAWNDWAQRASDPIGIPFNGVVEISVPEPSAFAFVAAMGLTGVCLLRRRNQ